MCNSIVVSCTTLLWITLVLALAASTNADPQYHHHPKSKSTTGTSNSKHLRRILKKRNVLYSTSDTQRQMQKAAMPKVNNNFKTNPPTMAPTYSFYSSFNEWMQQHTTSETTTTTTTSNNSSSSSSSVNWNMSLLVPPKDIDRKDIDTFATPIPTTPIMTSVQQMSLHQIIIQYICDHTDYLVVHMVEQNKTLYNACTSTVVQDFYNFASSTTVLVTDFQNKFGLIEVVDKSVYYTHDGKENQQVYYIQWIVWGIHFPILQLSTEDTVAKVQNRLSTILTTWMKDPLSSSSISNIVAVSPVGSEVQTLMQTLVYSNDEGIIIKGDEVQGKDQVFWHGTRIAGFALAGFLTVILGTLFKYSRRSSEKYHIGAGEDHVELEDVHDLNEHRNNHDSINTTTVQTTRIQETQKTLKRMKESEEWVSIQISPKLRHG